MIEEDKPTALEGCIWVSIGLLLGFLFVVYVTVRVASWAWHG